ncbi:hypothetical protein MKK69_12010 [Methylobacterium sp. J-026]|nr:hypothetical protein [Methylobacterium sp. J-026]
MHIRLDRASKAFGRRRPAGAAVDLDRRNPVRRGTLLGWSLRVSAVAGLLAVAGASQLARWNKLSDPPSRIFATAAPVPPDPETTGAIPDGVGAARATRPDPRRRPVSDRLRP